VRDRRDHGSRRPAQPGDGVERHRRID
jgi:hypothetical protein